MKAFTFVELTIVLVIIALLIAAVLAGDSLLESSRIKKEISIYHNLEAAVNNFKDKYAGLPGDLSQARANMLQLGNFDPEGTEGDGIIDAAAANWTNSAQAVAARNLAANGLINLNSAFDPTDNNNNQVGAGILPAATGSGGVVLYGSGIGNYIRYGVLSNNGNAPLLLQQSAGISVFTPLQARQIDEKIDDGNALSGLVTSRGAGVNAGSLGAAASAGCNDGNGTYANGSTAACGLAIEID